MIFYLDTSALVKKYFKEAGSADVISKWKEASALATSSVAYAESIACFFRKKRETNIRKNIFSSLIDSFQQDWKSFISVEVNNDLNQMIDRIIALYPLRGFDAIHLVSALIISEATPEGLTFGCFDKVLLEAATSEGLNTFPEEIE